MDFGEDSTISRQKQPLTAPLLAQSSNVCPILKCPLFWQGGEGGKGVHCDESAGGGSARSDPSGSQQEDEAWEAAQQLGLSLRQVMRLVRRYRRDGPIGLVSRHRGKRPNNALSQAMRKQAMGLVPDFGPTLACEKLQEHHQLELSVETLRQWMIAEGL